MRTNNFIFGMAMLMAAMVQAEEAAKDEALAMREASLSLIAKQAPSAVGTLRSADWQAIAPKSLKRSMRPLTSAEYRYAPRLVAAERASVERHRPATEQLALGLSSDPPRPAYPQLAAGPRTAGPSLSSVEHLQLPPLSRTSEAKISLVGDAASVAAKPFTARVANATRGLAPPRFDVGTPDPFLAKQEVELRTPVVEADPPAANFDVPDRLVLPVKPVKK